MQFELVLRKEDSLSFTASGLGGANHSAFFSTPSLEHSLFSSIMDAASAPAASDNMRELFEPMSTLFSIENVTIASPLGASYKEFKLTCNINEDSGRTHSQIVDAIMHHLHVNERHDLTVISAYLQKLDHSASMLPK